MTGDAAVAEFSTDRDLISGLAAMLLAHRLRIRAGVPECSCGAPLPGADMHVSHAVHTAVLAAGIRIGASTASPAG